MYDALYLFGLFLNVDGVMVSPAAEVGSHELIDLGQEMVPDHGGADQGQQRPSHVPVGGPVDGGNVAFAQYVEHGLRVPGHEAHRFVHEDEPVELRVHGHNCRAPQNVGLVQTPVPINSIKKIKHLRPNL